MRTTAWRFLVVAALALWLGGMTFYAAVVVPIGTEVLGSPAEQGFITRRVAVWINVLGAGALALFFLDWLPRRGWTRLGIWVGLALLQVVLFVVWPWMDVFLDPENHSFLDHRAFRFWHKVYIWVFTVQWFLGLAHTWLLLRGWQQPPLSGTTKTNLP